MVLCAGWLLHLSAVLHISKSLVRAEDSSYIYFDNIPYLANASNVVSMSWPDLKAAFTSPNKSDIASFEGFDWTKPYPGRAVSSFSAHLRIADEVPFPDTVTTENVFTDVTALTFVIPPSLMGSDGLPKAMDPSWFICQHFFVSNVPDPTEDVAHDCSFLPAACQTDLVNSLVDSWGSLYNETGAMCGANALDRIAPSCRDPLGAVTADVLAWNYLDLQNPVTAKALTVDEVGQYSWMIGTGFNDPHNQTSHYAASNRTYIAVTVFGYDSQVTGASKPAAKLACLRPKWASPSVSSTTPTATAPLRPTASVESSTSSARSLTTTTSMTSSSSAAPATSSKATSTASPTATGHCLGMVLSSAIIFYLLVQRDIDAMRGIRIPSDISCIYPAYAVYGIRHHDTFARSKDVVDKKFARARNARLIMSNEIPNMATNDVKPYCIWYPDIASEETYRSLAKQYPDMIYAVGRACALAGYDKLYHELGILPEVSIAEEARDNAAKSGSKAIFDHIMSQPVCYSILDDYTRTANTTNPRSPAFMNGDTAVRSLLDVRIGLDQYAKFDGHYFDIVEDYYVAETSSELNHSDFQALDPEHVDMIYTPLLSHLPAVTKDPLILMAAYEGNLDRYIRLRRPQLLRQEEKAIIRGIYHNTTFAKYWSLQDLSRYPRGREITRATIARFIMVNDLSHITSPTTPAQRDMPGMIWWPLLPDEITLRELARRRPDMKLQVAMACIAANYERLWKELNPEPAPELWSLARGQFTVHSDYPVRSYFTDYMERQGWEHVSAAGVRRHDEYYDNTHGLCETAAVLDKEPTSIFLRPRVDFPMTSEAQDSVYSNCWQANAADWELFICSTDEQRQKARDCGGFYFFYEEDCPPDLEPGYQAQGEIREPEQAEQPDNEANGPEDVDVVYVDVNTDAM
ncbi:hypothetical protein CONLIGDRAFT_660508 [Coniochaeta ligniaria NRRL 30616]|uniref:Uncharacterized protein n=1 Tax=Coniochaeta ligniaria NRRL 30616 TaxID=1408157 RepID=A0A1J7JXX6_9PEZI|nr:hypothetical protein CONLIGDRAFT_660508 [Coniochaeta ligniaria NRRL 30616]